MMNEVGCTGMNLWILMKGLPTVAWNTGYTYFSYGMNLLSTL
jgi:hypothetical protein